MRLAAAPALAGLALAAGSLALASGIERTRTVTVASFDSGHATAGCPPGRGLAAGGFKASTARRKGLVMNSYRPLSARRFTAGATNTFVNPAKLTVIAECARSRHLARRARSTTIPGARAGSRSSAAISVECPRGKTVRLGGFEADVSSQPSGAAVSVTSLVRPSPRRLTVAADNVGPAEGVLRVIALCGRGPKLAAARRSVALPDAGGRSTATARCPAGDTAAFGGFRASGNDGNGPYLAQLRRPTPGAWRAGAFQFPRHGAQLTAIAYCG